MKFAHSPIDLGYDDLSYDTSQKSRHYFTPNGVSYPSITNILSLNGNEYIEKWRKAVGEKEADRVLHHAGTRGNAQHDLAERYLNNEFDDVPKGLMPHVQLAFSALKKVLDENIGTVYLQECALFSDILKIAGRVDLIADYNDTLSVIDFKTSTRYKTEEEIENYFIQAAFYAAAFYERTGIPIKQTVIIMTVDGKSIPHVFKNTPHKWLPKLVEIRKKYEN